MKIVHQDEKQIKGFSIRTANAKEMNPATSKIGALHQLFGDKVAVNYKIGGSVYGVYYNYESDYSGEYSVLAGADQIESTLVENLETVTIPAGTYMVFEAKGSVPQIVIETWSKIWEYFSTGNAQYQRSYKTDFELYKSQNEIEIYIAVE